MKERIRHIESTLLDTHYRSQGLLGRPQLEAVSHLLKVYGNLHRDWDAPAFHRYSARTTRQMYMNLFQGLEHSLRWVLHSCDSSSRHSGVPWQEVDAEATELLLWGMSYAQLCADHISWSRGLMDAHLDEESRTITFLFRHDDSSVLISQRTFEEFTGDDFLHSLPRSLLAGHFRKWSAGFDLKRPSELPDFEWSPDAPPVSLVLEGVRKAVFPELDDSEDLDGFTLGDYRQFYASLFCQCECIAMLEERCDREAGRDNNLGSIVFQLPRQEMSEYLCHVSGIREDRVSRILSDAIFDHQSFGSSLATQPFVLTDCGHITVLARLFSHIIPTRTLAGSLIARRKHVYERIVETMERGNVEMISEDLHRRGFVVKTHKRLVDDSGNQVCPDLLVLDVQRRFLLIADYKHALTPLGPAQVGNRVREYEKHIRQIKKYGEFASRCPNIVSRACGSKETISGYSMMLLYRWPMPIPVARDPDVLIADWPSLRRMLDAEHVVDLAQTCERYQEACQLPVSELEWVPEYHEIKVGDWTYRHPIVAADVHAR